jgi:hypothetical protein
MRKLDQIIAIAKRHGLRLILSNFLEWEAYPPSGRMKEDKESQYYDAKVIAKLD